MSVTARLQHSITPARRDTFEMDDNPTAFLASWSAQLTG